MREATIYQPEVRRNIPNNVYCPYCGNTNQWQIDLRLLHNLQMGPGGIEIALDQNKAEKFLSSVQRHIDRMVFLSSDSKKPFLHCANCSNSDIDVQEAILEMCYNTGCPGCFHCGNWIDESDVRDSCLACIKDNDGDVDEDHCFTMCPHYDYGLEEVRQHYNITLDELKTLAGYGDG